MNGYLNGEGKIVVGGRRVLQRNKKNNGTKVGKKKVYSGTVAKYKFEADREIKIVDARLRSLK